jgi:hypothetical protein
MQRNQIKCSIVFSSIRKNMVHRKEQPAEQLFTINFQDLTMTSGAISQSSIHNLVPPFLCTPTTPRCGRAWSSGPAAPSSLLVGLLQFNPLSSQFSSARSLV